MSYHNTTGQVFSFFSRPYQSFHFTPGMLNIFPPNVEKEQHKKCSAMKMFFYLCLCTIPPTTTSRLPCVPIPTIFKDLFNSSHQERNHRHTLSFKYIRFMSAVKPASCQKLSETQPCNSHFPYTGFCITLTRSNYLSLFVFQQTVDFLLSLSYICSSSPLQCLTLEQIPTAGKTLCSHSSHVLQRGLHPGQKKKKTSFEPYSCHSARHS